MKREDAILELIEFFDDDLRKYTLSELAERTLTFFEKEIGMLPPDCSIKTYLHSGWGDVAASEREREFQSKKDSCI